MFNRLVSLLTGRDTRERMASLERAVRKLAEAGQDQATTLRVRVDDIARALDQQPTGKDLRELRQAIRGLAALSDHRQLFDALEPIASSGRPILVGPWTGEVGFELLYWIPFVEWVRTHWELTGDREMVMSRGGVASWYGRPEGSYVDAFTFVSPDEFRDAVAAEKRKQRRVGAFDDRLVEAALRGRSPDEVDLLHPRLMYKAFEPYWRDDAGYARIDQFTRYRLLDVPAAAAPSGLPADYVAVRFYFSDCFPDTPENRVFAKNVVASLAERSPVVLLNPGFSVDEHTDWTSDAPGRIVTIDDHVTPERNLAVQSAVIGGARAFVGTYGGYAYLAPLYRVPSIAFYSKPTFKLQHLHTAQRAFSEIAAAALVPIDVAQVELMQLALGALAPA